MIMAINDVTSCLNGKETTYGTDYKNKYNKLNKL